MLYTPFSRLPRQEFTAPKGFLDRQKFHSAALAQNASVELPYKLDIWFPKKTMSVGWSDAGKFDLISFAPGDWDRDLFALLGLSSTVRMTKP